jgi:phosphatidylserine/phosphatidylglycerophosphate/cardiolipin synthase-like enzyme
MDHRPTIIAAVADLADSVPVDVLVRVAQVLSSCPTSEARSRVADAVPNLNHRTRCLRFVGVWLSSTSPVSGLEVAMSLRTAAHLGCLRDKGQTIELVWTGPRSPSSSPRYTEQAVLQVLDSSLRRVTLVSYAVYCIPHVSSALVRAARRGVGINVIVETPDPTEGQHEYDTIKALGDDVVACSSLYYWPRDRRKRDPTGRVGSLHVKCLAADSRWLFLSSANLTEYAFTLNMELGLLVTGGELPGRVEGHFDRLIADGVLARI